VRSTRLFSENAEGGGLPLCAGHDGTDTPSLGREHGIVETPRPHVQAVGRGSDGRLSRRGVNMPRPRPHAANGARPQTSWRALVAPYQRSDDRVAAWQLANTLLPYLGLIALMAWSLRGPYWVTLLLALPAAAFLARTFVLFHDCGHDSLFSRRRVNVAVGLALSLLVWEAFHYWRHIHGVHHATSSHLGRRGTGDYDTLTVKEYLALPPRRRFAYRLSRHPVFLFLVLPCFKFTLYNRLRLRPAPQPAWRSVPLTNLALIVVYGGAMALLGWRDVLQVMLPVFWFASLIGLWLFYVQHQFEQAYWAPQGQWDRASAALRGSSYYRLPPLLNWFTASIGFHHVHHLAPRIPNYHLAQCHREQPALQSAPTLSLRQSLQSLRCQLWDEELGRMVAFDSVRL
jgi:acyl-lipid omega-6 desaturase (Delta-12 desaturase)